MKRTTTFFAFALFILTQCSETSQRCETYECRRKNFWIYLENEHPVVEEATLLIVKRREFYLPNMRVLIGDYDENFKLPTGEDLQYFQGTDSVATINLIFESAGQKVIRGIIEEYKPISKDTVESYHYQFEITVEVSEPTQQEKGI